MQRGTINSIGSLISHLTSPPHPVSYAARALQLSQIFNQRQNTPLQTAVWSVEHVLQHGGLAVELLHSPGIELNWFVYHSLDSLVLLLALLWLLNASWRALTQSNPSRRRRKSRKS